MEKYYLTTAIAYASSIPHIGNVYEAIFADAVARYKRSKGYQVFFQTGTDEHGQKIEDKAKDKNMSSQEYVDYISSEIKRIYDDLFISYDAFIRTTDEVHQKVVSDVYQKLFEKGDIYKGSYEGLYCVSCESFFKVSDVVNNKCPDCGKELKIANEEAYFFKLSNYQERLVKYIMDHPGFIEPESRKNEMLFLLKDKLPDLCVTRSTLKWGIPVPFDPKHVSYVWMDALLNYISGIGYDVNEKNIKDSFKEFWPCDLHIIGKDVLRFHVIYWPIFLMALDLPLPKKIFGHPWILADKKKMSKSVGNVMDTDSLVKYFGIDAVRYYCLHEIPYQVDGNITYELIIERYNSDLVNNLSNLVNRTLSMAKKYFNNEFEFNYTELSKSFFEDIDNSKKKYFDYLDNLRISDGFDEVFNIFRRANKFIDETEPWVLAKSIEDSKKLKEVIASLIEAIRQGAILLGVFMPSTSLKMLELINIKDNSFNSLDNKIKEKIIVNDPSPLFMRIDIEKKLKEINDYENEKHI